MGPIDPAAGSALRTPRTSVVRHPERAAYDFETIAAVLDEGLFCHLGFVADGQPYVIPTNYARRDRTLYVHGTGADRRTAALERPARRVRRRRGPPPAAPPSYNVVPGWNLIGFKKTASQPANQYLSAINGKYTVIYGFANGAYFIVTPSQNLEPGRGYWLAVTEAGTIYP